MGRAMEPNWPREKASNYPDTTQTVRTWLIGFDGSVTLSQSVFPEEGPDSSFPKEFQNSVH